jgi:hypothetical protein
MTPACFAPALVAPLGRDGWVRLAVIRYPTGRGHLDVEEELCGASHWL